MKVLWQIAVITGVCFVGEGISLILPIPFPSGVIGMILLFLLLLFKRIQPRDLKESTDFLTDSMKFLFVPAGVGVMQIFDDIRNSFLPMVFICIVTTVITFAATAAAVNGTIKFQQWLRVRRRKPV
ncbi:MAG: CidA/LrgA family protein [Oscillospiraceae bacterium]|jgi:holin-like protein|nr:CidA/LrgA family protein [Oscillospiraceae bacterium]